MLLWKLILIYSMQFPCLTGAGAKTSLRLGPHQKFRLLAAPAPQHCQPRLNILLDSAPLPARNGVFLKI